MPKRPYRICLTALMEGLDRVLSATDHQAERGLDEHDPDIGELGAQESSLVRRHAAGNCSAAVPRRKRDWFVGAPRGYPACTGWTGPVIAHLRCEKQLGSSSSSIRAGLRARRWRLGQPAQAVLGLAYGDQGGCWLPRRFVTSPWGLSDQPLNWKDVALVARLARAAWWA